MKGRILTSLLTVIVLTGLQAQNVPAVPKLVVGLTIDQLRTDYICLLYTSDAADE